MLDFSWSELLVVLIVAVFAIGPKQLPEVLYSLGRIVRRLQYMRFAVTRQFDDFMAETELQDINRIGRDLRQNINQKPQIFDEAAYDDHESDIIEHDPAKLPQPEKDKPEKDKEERV